MQEKDFNALEKMATDLGMTHAVVIDTGIIVFSEEFRAICEGNGCGSYGKNWMCPPGVGESADLIRKVQGYSRALLVQYVHQLEDSFDFEGMQDGKQHFHEAFDKVIAGFDREAAIPRMLLSAGGCTICESCAYPEPCLHPDRAIPSLEAHCIYVNQTLLNAGLKYNNGEATVYFAGMILFD